MAAATCPSILPSKSSLRKTSPRLCRIFFLKVGLQRQRLRRCSAELSCCAQPEQDLNSRAVARWFRQTTQRNSCDSGDESPFPHAYYFSGDFKHYIFQASLCKFTTNHLRTLICNPKSSSWRFVVMTSRISHSCKQALNNHSNSIRCKHTKPIVRFNKKSPHPSFQLCISHMGPQQNVFKWKNSLVGVGVLDTGDTRSAVVASRCRGRILVIGSTSLGIG